MSQNIWFTADLHIGHKNILKHQPNRITHMNLASENDVDKHDKWLINYWNRTVKREDIVYICGDFIMGNKQFTEKVLKQLVGNKHLILGNHDRNWIDLNRYFQSVSFIKELKFKPENHPFLKETFELTLQHYAMLIWNKKHYGSCQVMGHSHGSLDAYNELQNDLRVDVGFDSKLANFEFVSLEKLYNYFKEKTKGMAFLDYAVEKRKELDNSFLV